MKTAPSRDPIPPGTLGMLVLRTLERHDTLHGFQIAEAISAISADVLQIEEGSLYPALQRLLLQGWVRAEWGRTDENRRARYYQLTASGRRQLGRAIEDYERIARAIALVLRTT